MSSALSLYLKPITDPPAVPEHRSVVFRARTQCRTGPLTGAQLHMLTVLQNLGQASASTNLVFTLRLRSGIGEEEVLGAVRDLVETFDQLRTVYLPPPDGPARRVLSSGELTIPVVERGPSVRASAAAELATAMWSIPFDISGEWPIRVGLVSAAGRPRYLVLVACHLMVDRAGGAGIRHHLRAVLAETPSP